MFQVLYRTSFSFHKAKKLIITMKGRFIVKEEEEEEEEIPDSQYIPIPLSLVRTNRSHPQDTLHHVYR